MRRDDCLKALARHRTSEIVVAVYKAAQEWIHISPSDLNYTFIGAMGQAPAHALGLALGRPDKRLIVLDGDGSLLMNLGGLVTIAQAAPRNLVHCVCRNGNYESNGSVPIPGGEGLSFAALARAAGYVQTYEFDELVEWERSLDRLLHDDGPIFVELRLEPGEDYGEDFDRLSSLTHREAFRKALAGS
jgi:sulfopyruvate decarboxylase subunit beta